MKYLILTFSIWFWCFGVNAYDSIGNDKDNGGDICEETILSIRRQLNDWILISGHQQLDLSDDITHNDYQRQMLYSFATTIVSCTDENVSVKKSEKTCKNFIDSEGVNRIICHRYRFNNTLPEEQYRLIHHEYAGVAGFETNQLKEESRYFITNQLAAFSSKKVENVIRITKKPSSSLKYLDGIHYIGTNTLNINYDEFREKVFLNYLESNRELNFILTDEGDSFFIEIFPFPENNSKEIASDYVSLRFTKVSEEGLMEVSLLEETVLDGFWPVKMAKEQCKSLDDLNSLLCPKLNASIDLNHFINEGFSFNIDLFQKDSLLQNSQNPLRFRLKYDFLNNHSIWHLIYWNSKGEMFSITL